MTCGWWPGHQRDCHYRFFKDVIVKPESMASEVVITKEMEQEEKQLMEEGERKEKEMMKKVCCLFIMFFFFENYLQNCIKSGQICNLVDWFD